MPTKQRTFTAKMQVGDIPAGHTFSEEDFKLLHPLPDNPAKHKINPDTYHSDLLARLLANKAIEPAVEEAEPAPIPEGAQAIAQKQAELQEPEPVPAQPAPAVVPKAK